MKVEFRLSESRRIGDQRNNWLHKRLWFNTKHNEHVRLCPRQWRLGTDADTKRELR